MTSFFRRMRRRLRLFYMVPLALWTRGHRADLRRALPILSAAPTRIRDRQMSDLLTEARTLLALGTDPRTQGRSAIELCEVRDGVARIRVDSANEIDALTVVGRVPGVRVVEVGPTAEVIPTDGQWHIEQPAFA